jgi:hypothetical protein
VAKLLVAEFRAAIPEAGQQPNLNRTVIEIDETGSGRAEFLC